MNQKLKSFFKGAFPPAVWLSRRRSKPNALGARDVKDVFTDIYLRNEWADPESVSGRGSTLARTAVIRAELADLLESVGAQSLLDASCGDFNWMRHVDLSGIKYIGADVVRELVDRNRIKYGAADRSFVALDITRDCLPKSDVILCRDCLIHLSFEHAHAAIANCKQSGSKYLLATTHATVTENTDIASGAWRNVNLRLPPYNFPSPLREIVEDSAAGKNLSLWRLEDL